MYRVGIDVGGTNLAVGVVNEDYEIISHVSIPTNRDRPGREILDDMSRAVYMALDKVGIKIEECESVGIGAPGTCIVEKGIVARSYGLNWENFPLSEEMEKYFHIPVRIDNDANCAALAEVVAGAAKGYKNVVLCTLGTGVGSGIILDGKIFSGRNGAGAEFGHMTINHDGDTCIWCGRRGCWDGYSSATGLIRQAKAAAEKNPESLLNKVEEINGKAVFDGADQGDAVAQAVIDQFCEYLAIGLTNVANALAPEMILVGGGISRQGERILAPVRKMVLENCFDKREEALPIIKAAQLGNEAGIIGAAAL